MTFQVYVAVVLGVFLGGLLDTIEAQKVTASSVLGFVLLLGAGLAVLIL